MTFHWNWQQPHKAVGRMGTGEPDPISALTSWLDAYHADEEKKAEAFRASPLATSIDRALNVDEQNSRRIVLAEAERRKPRNEIEDAIQELRLLPSYLRDPLIRHLSFLRKKQETERRKGKKAHQADRYVQGKLRKILARIRLIDERFCTRSFQLIAARERLDAMLHLPQLSKREVQTLATLTAGAFSGKFERLCDGYGDDITPNDMLAVYQRLGRMALALNVTPPYWESLRTDTNRRSEPDLEKLPGALLRLSCADWWNNKLWDLRRVWREEQLRAACQVSCKTSSYMSREALADFREQRERMRNFLKSWELENEDGFTISLEDVYYAGNSNPRNRRSEMMATCKGLELIAEARGDQAAFLTVTAPSRFHATTQNGNPNTKWCGATIRDSSDYLVHTFFAAVRKHLNKAKLRWYGVRVAEPHHDGTVHWHMLVFAHPENIERIIEIACDVAIREDRHELGNDISPRFECEYITPDKGTPTSYIATYIGKNLDGSAMKGNDPKTGEPYLDNESGLPITESVERAVGWAGLHRVRQFQFFGIPSRQVWRELRRLACQMARTPEGPQRLKNDAMDAVLAAADAGCFASYIMKQGGVLIPRSNYLIRTAYELADEPNDYDELGTQIYGIWSPQFGEDSRVCTHPDNWKLVRRKPKAKDGSPENGFDLQGGPAAPWTRGNNCPPAQETDNSGTEATKEQTAPWPQIPEGAEVSDWLRSLNLRQHRALSALLREKPQTPANKESDYPIERKTAPQLPDNHQELATEWRKDAESLGLSLSDNQIAHLLRGGSLRLSDCTVTTQGNRLVRQKPDTTDSTITAIWQRIRHNHGVDTARIRHNPVGYYTEMIEAADPNGAQLLSGKPPQEKKAVTTLSDMLHAMRDKEHQQHLEQARTRLQSKAHLLGALSDNGTNNKQKRDS
ncbi:MAG: replication endonuclease [Hafnia sp.]